MKQTNRFSVMAVIVGALLFAGCTDDVYDPERGIKTEPKDNPLGENFSAPDGFDWSMINSVNLNVGVKDELNGSYEYLIEVFTDNPLSNSEISPVAVGVANKSKNYTAQINLSKAIKSVYIRQTDPKQRKEIYTFNVPENGGTLDCKLYYEGAISRAAARAAQSAGTSGWDKIEEVTYTEENYNVPSESATPTSWNTLSSGEIFVIKPGETYIGALHCDGGTNASVYVQGTWNLDGATPRGINIVVLNGGKITAPNTGFMVSDKSSLTVQTGGLVNCKYFSTAANVVIKNFGTIQANGIKGQYNEIGFNSGAVLYNGSNATFNVEENFNITSSKIFNHGTITVGNKILTNNSTNCVIANYDQSSIIADELIGGATIVNNGFIEVNTCKDSSVGILYNNCTFIAKKAFHFRNVVLNKGSITGGRVNATSTEWLPIPYIESQTDAKFTLIDGSMIKATRFEVKSGTVTFEAKNTTNSSKSMIKAEEYIHFSDPTNASLLGNLVVEGEITGTNKWNELKKNESVNTGFDESKYTIETCGGIFNEGNEGEAPSNPNFPIITEDADTYTFAFEDNWPVYGDFDMNDLVLTLTKKKLKVNKAGNVENLHLFVEIRAVGANKNLGVGIRFSKLPEGLNSSKFDVNKKQSTFEEDQEAPTYILTTNAHNTLWKNEYTGQERRINTIPGGPLQKNPEKFLINMNIPASANVKAEDLNINNIDIFIITAPANAKGKRTEVHVAGFPPTDLGGTQHIGSGNDNSSKTESVYYLSKENLAWAIVVPQEFMWPQENNKITGVYDLFESWIVSGGQNNKDWYNSHNNKVFPIGDLTPAN